NDVTLERDEHEYAYDSTDEDRADEPPDRVRLPPGSNKSHREGDREADRLSADERVPERPCFFDEKQACDPGVDRQNECERPPGEAEKSGADRTPERLGLRVGRCAGRSHGC